MHSGVLSATGKGFSGQHDEIYIHCAQWETSEFFVLLYILSILPVSATCFWDFIEVRGVTSLHEDASESIWGYWSTLQHYAQCAGILAGKVLKYGEKYC